MRILIYKGKYETEYFDVSDKEKEETVYRHLFKYMYEMGYYGDIDLQDVLLLDQAIAGDIKAIRSLLFKRSNQDYEYETFHFVLTTLPVS